MKPLQSGDPQRVGRYHLLGRLGAGGMGQVFLGQSPGGRLVAVKLIRAELAADREFRVRFAREVAAARNVSGMFTAPVVDADPEAPQPWLVTAYVPGPSLADTVDGQGPLPLTSVLTLAAGLAEGLGAIHAEGMVHRDLKPSNVLLASDGPRIIDFGISRAADATALTRVNFVIGSPGFMSPEQALGEGAGPPSDIFSLGAVLAFAAVGEGPFGVGTATELLYRVVHDLPDTGRLPGRIRPLVERCLAKDPRWRPTTDQFLTELGTIHFGATWLPQPVAETLSGYAWPLPAAAADAMVPPTPAPSAEAPPAEASHAEAPPAEAPPAAASSTPVPPTLAPATPAPPTLVPPAAAPPAPPSPVPGPHAPAPAPEPHATESSAPAPSARTPTARASFADVRSPDGSASRPSPEPSAAPEAPAAGPSPAPPAAPGTPATGPSLRSPADPEVSPWGPSPRPSAGSGEPVPPPVDIWDDLFRKGPVQKRPDSGHPPSVTTPLDLRLYPARPRRRRWLGRALAAGALVVVLAAAGLAALALISRTHPGGQPTPTAGSPAVPRPRAVVEAYFAAINAHHWRKVWNLGGKNLSPTYGAMVAGYRSTARDVLTYVKTHGDRVSLRLIAHQTDGTVQTYQASYVVRNGVITTAHNTLLRTS